MRVPAAILLALAGTAAQAVEYAVDSEHWTREYDPIFQKYAHRYFGPYFDWRWFKSQAITESNLNPVTRSGAGAVGLMQILPSTYAEILKTNPYFADIVSPRWNIAAGIFYDRALYRHPAWNRLADEQQLLMAFAGYNAGLGGALRAYRQTPPPADSWTQVSPYAPRETQGYVVRIVTIKTGATGARPPWTLRDPSTRGLSGKLRRMKGE
jgi:soluble lytic murein transglycosylase-like protein